MVSTRQLVPALEHMFDKAVDPTVMRVLMALRRGIATNRYRVHGGDFGPEVKEFLGDPTTRIVGCFVAGTKRSGQFTGMFLSLDGQDNGQALDLVNHHYRQYIAEHFTSRSVRAMPRLPQMQGITAVLWMAYAASRRTPVIWHRQSLTPIQGACYLNASLRHEINRQLDRAYPSPSYYLR